MNRRTIMQKYCHTRNYNAQKNFFSPLISINHSILKLFEEKIYGNSNHFFIKLINGRIFRRFFLRPISIRGDLERIISIRGDLEWQARSPDLIPCDFYLWGYLKSRVYVNRPRSLQDLQANIREEIANIPADTLVNTKNRFIQCMDNGGRHLPDVIFKTV